jgi:hypothetical protein
VPLYLQLAVLKSLKLKISDKTVKLLLKCLCPLPFVVQSVVLAHLILCPKMAITMPKCLEKPLSVFGRLKKENSA